MITWRARAYKPCEAASSAVYLTNQAKSGTRRSPDRSPARSRLSQVVLLRVVVDEDGEYLVAGQRRNPHLDRLIIVIPTGNPSSQDTAIPVTSSGSKLAYDYLCPRFTHQAPRTFTGRTLKISNRPQPQSATSRSRNIEARQTPQILVGLGQVRGALSLEPSSDPADVRQ